MDVNCIKREGSILLKIQGEAEYELTEGEAIRLYNALERVIPAEMEEVEMEEVEMEKP